MMRSADAIRQIRYAVDVLKLGRATGRDMRGASLAFLCLGLKFANRDNDRRAKAGVMRMSNWLRHNIRHNPMPEGRVP